MPEITHDRRSDSAGGRAAPVIDEVLATRAGLAALLRDAAQARRLRAEAAAGDGDGAVCAWNHFENIPTFYNWNNRPR